MSDDDHDGVNDDEYEEEDDYDGVNNNSDIEFIWKRKKLLNENIKGKTYLTILYIITLQYLIDICVDDDGDNTSEEDKKGHVIDKALDRDKLPTGDRDFKPYFESITAALFFC